MIHIDTQGAEITVFCLHPADEGGGPFDLTQYPTRQIEIRDPAGAITPHTATTVGSDVDGVLQWVSTLNFFDGQPGDWYSRPKVTKDSTHVYPGDWKSFPVGA